MPTYHDCQKIHSEVYELFQNIRSKYSNGEDQWMDIAFELRLVLIEKMIEIHTLKESQKTKN